MNVISATYDLKLVELGDKPVFDQAFATLTQPLSDYTFTNTYIWRNGLKLYWKLIHGHLCVFANGNGDLTMLIPPVGEGDLGSCLKTCVQIMDDYNDRVADRSRSFIEYVSDELRERMLPHGMTGAPMGGDYVYSTQKMIELAGGDLKSKRQARSKFMREHHVETRPLTDELVRECVSLLHQWQRHGDEEHAEGEPFAKEAAVLRRRDTLATELALTDRDALGLVGMTLWADGRLVGFTLGEKLGTTQASIVIEKTDLEVYGSAQYIFSEFCRQYWSGRPEVNAGDDWGIPSLKWTKESYRPLRLQSKYVLSAPPEFRTGWTPAMDAQREIPQLIIDANPRHMTSAGVPDDTDAGLVIETAAPADAAALAQLERRVFTQDVAINKRQMSYLLHSKRALVSVARTADHKVVGWIIVLFRKHRNHESARIYSLAVDPEMRGKGLGHQLVEHALTEIHARNIYRCFLEVAEDNEPAKHLYERLGFVPIATLPNYYGEGRNGKRMLRVDSASQELVSATFARPIGMI